jgi:hypothetical protein
MATSVWRDGARAINNAATLAQAINKTSATAPCISNSGRPIHPNSASRTGLNCTDHGFP